MHYCNFMKCDDNIFLRIPSDEHLLKEKYWSRLIPTLGNYEYFNATFKFYIEG